MAESRIISLEQYLNESNIRLTNNSFDNVLENITENKVLEQIDTIYGFHKSVLGCNSIIFKSIPNKIGKTVEKYKIRIKNLKRDLKGFKDKSTLNEFENMVLKTSDNYLSRAEKCIDIVNRCNYINLVKRSMQRFEICLGNTYFDNLRNSDGLEINSLKKCAYNMLEMDGIYLINKVKKNKNDIDLEKIINYFCKIEQFDKYSNNFIRALISYPHAYMKCCERYRLSKKQWDINEYVMSLNRAMKLDCNDIIL
ncbi:hypothetical protein CPAST_c02400 [Clostridium pasteurianum DSM 525 = ATCC 6013]|uniref:Spore coat protein n=1 Tax=Clostridium pasteurianum DSM 525 = ATCC 6013 TaxID=1262449 RepID=A0A0H3J5Y5_CLOPA|nr:hypothetical protein [Clostridium pasteurianum]AJA46340.1 hypothetical protein CPAST_c02400 [Clostridium pasteurianum DSM 525 = ATCC 6013]AJA50328.1 hypothetical protein CLPA_c02400 [Clostridium pasteurianum DSM 525 = ATCC 6013]AOZ73782.1 hypothetical protein AQ983_01155 [Clostridium pasteurianum DSM 525 = ATCC 6013]AOZ77579.1 hypothetical protein AQ984_01155 [Clostridium pasteurianum]ELP60917.1 hypothetical protein F502_00620 [Clostridium pasteurianum DSM 525 = ATCC 6013]